MIQPAAPTLAPSAPTAPSPAGAGGENGVFTLSLAGFLDTIESGGEAIKLPEETAGRHDDAGGGNALPGDTNKDAPAIDPALAWLSLPVPASPEPRPIAFVPPVAGVSTPATVGGPDTVDAAAALPALPVGTGIGDAAPIRSTTPAVAARVPAASAAGNDSPAASIAALLEGLPATILPTRAPSPQREPSVPDAQLSATPSAPASTLPDRANDTGRAAPAVILPLASARNTPIAPPSGETTDVPFRTPPSASPANPVAAPPPAPIVAPIIAEVIAEAVVGALRPAAQDEPAVATRRADELTGQPTTITPLDTKPVAVPATGDAQTPTLDLRQERWTHSIIDHIERLCDGIDAADTRIRLVPDALGSIDVSVRKDGDTLHVHFAAEQAATRTILHDAQPRLAEIAEQRGLKLGQTGVGGGSAEGNRQPPQPQPQQSQSPRPASPRSSAPRSTDDRLA